MLASYFFYINPETDEVELSPEIRLIEPFKSIIIRDKGGKGDSQARNKYQAKKELAFIYWFGLLGSPDLLDYDITKENELAKAEDSIKKKVGLDEGWLPDKLVLEGVVEWKFKQRTKSLKIYETCAEGYEELDRYIKEVDLTSVIEAGVHKGELVYDAKNFASVIKEYRIGSKELQAAEKELLSEYLANMSTVAKNKGRNKVNPLEKM